MALEPWREGDPLSAARLTEMSSQIRVDRELGIAGIAGSSGASGTTGGAPLATAGTADRYFELLSNLAPGTSASAYRRFWDSDAEDYVTDFEVDTFTVYDVLSEYRGRARDEGASGENDSGGERGKHGSFGRAIQRHGRWEIEHLEAHADHITCIANEPGSSSPPAGWETTDETVGVDSVVVIQPTDQALLMADVNVVYNVHGWDGDDASTIKADWNDDQERWEMYSADCLA